jgi:hypothetical protein
MTAPYPVKAEIEKIIENLALAFRYVHRVETANSKQKKPGTLAGLLASIR